MSREQATIDFINMMPPFRDVRVISAVVTKFHFNPLKDFLVGASARFLCSGPLVAKRLYRPGEIRLKAKEQ
jgi:hypothetical protein